MVHYNYDLDNPDGEFGERVVRELLNGERGRIEVKRDFVVTNTGNVAIEYESRGKPSGIAKTEAKWWALILDGDKFAHQIVILVKTDRLKDIARTYYRMNRRKPGGDNKSSKNVLIPVTELVRQRPDSTQPELI